jgi:hypothetical protein
MKRRVLMEVTNLGAVYINGTRVTDRSTKWGVHRTVYTGRVYAHRVTHNLVKHGYGHIKLDPDYAKAEGVS